MRTRMVWLIGMLALSAGGLLTWSLTRGQNPSGSKSSSAPATAPTAPRVGFAPEREPPVPEAKRSPSRDVGKLSPLQQQMYASALRGAEWLSRANRALGGAIPLELLDSDLGAIQVEQILGRISHGVYS